ncbi:MAG: sigma-70 family RNA polymerase sigma factor [Acidimicrobiia bacterium]|nr:sigma-70 family RNA polymerase sigma factor [Acidimicrobiia bacterium]MDH5289110.1 sigma-70 family RNA polymerase sigma factor [Acidimicrobiia bacterium]
MSELLTGCRQGDAGAWDLLLDRFEPLVFTIARREGLGMEDAADVTQTTFEALLAQLDRIQDDGQISYWLMTVARRQAWRQRTRRQRERLEPEPNGRDQAPELGAIPDVGTNLWLYAGLAELDAPCRELIQSLYFAPQPPSYAELADRMGRPLGSIGPTRARCLRRLRELLRDAL